MSYALYALAALLVFDALRLRGRVGRLAVLAPSGEPATHDVLAAPGVTVADTTRRAASAYMRAHGVDVLELVPRDLPAIDALVIAQLVDPATYRADRLSPGRTAGHAVVVSADVAARARATMPQDAIAFARLATRLKHYGPTELAVARDEHAHRRDISARFATLRAMLGPSTAFALAALPILLGVIAAGIALRPLPGLVALAAWQLQPALALAATKLAPRDLPLVVLLRAPIELALLVRTLLARRSDDVTARRAEYAHAFEGGVERFLEPRRDTCALCGSPELVVHLRHGDMFQHKPGTFTLERCRACGHVFQNPRLSLAGLDIYYKDFYDGLGETGMEFVFGFGASPYLQRARAMKSVREPARWLDVGAGHGHFCIAARGELPSTHFDGLDLSESIEEAQRRGWIETAYRGLFPELAPTLAGRYDAISMSHYLEHTLDPRKELEAAHTALADDGCLLIEVPDPEFKLGRVLRRYWLPWFQPQHLHLLSVKNLEKLLVERGFEPVVWHRGAAHQRVDFFFASYLLLDRLAPSPQLPWRPRGAAAAAWRVLVWTLGSPLVVAGIAIDNALGPFLSRARVSNTYRVVARKRATR
ncbi:MAG: class I SAM-dependent methyltransferase [Acidobacteriota bacterium]